MRPKWSMGLEVALVIGHSLSKVKQKRGGHWPTCSLWVQKWGGI